MTRFPRGDRGGRACAPPRCAPRPIHPVDERGRLAGERASLSSTRPLQDGDVSGSAPTGGRRSPPAPSIDRPDESVVSRLALPPNFFERRRCPDVAVHLPASGLPNRLHHVPPCGIRPGASSSARLPPRSASAPESELQGDSEPWAGVLSRLPAVVADALRQSFDKVISVGHAMADQDRASTCPRSRRGCGRRHGSGRRP